MELSSVTELFLLSKNKIDVSSSAQMNAATVVKGDTLKYSVILQHEVGDIKSSASMDVIFLSDVQTVHTGESNSDECESTNFSTAQAR